MKKYILALDQGTTSSRAILINVDGDVCGMAQQEFPQLYPHPGWVEHNPEDIWSSQVAVAERVLREAKTDAHDIAAIGIANQRETVILWERATGRPVANAIVWQDRRTANLCSQLRTQGLEPFFRARTGLPIDPYFSGTKIAWLLDKIPGLRQQAERGEIAFGTVDSFLLWRLTGGRVHATDSTNASRTLLYNILKEEWDDELLELLHIPHSLLPEVKSSGSIFGETSALLFGSPIPLAGIAGDQQAALLGQACILPGMLKNTYGTGSFLLMQTGEKAIFSHHDLLTTISMQIGEKIYYALEGSIFITGAAVQWLRDELQIIRSASEIEALAASVPNNGGVYFVPAFAGLGAPYWNSEARGAIIGLTRGAGRAHLARATLEAVCFQTRDVLEAMRADTSLPIEELKVDGGMTANNLLMQMQADLLGAVVTRPVIQETTALGAAYLAGLTTGFWNGMGQITSLWKADRTFIPTISEDERETLYSGWKRAIQQTIPG